jgi:hypothetical protein
MRIHTLVALLITMQRSFTALDNLKAVVVNGERAEKRREQKRCGRKNKVWSITP